MQGVRVCRGRPAGLEMVAHMRPVGLIAGRSGRSRIGWLGDVAYAMAWAPADIARALVTSCDLLMLLIRSGHQADSDRPPFPEPGHHARGLIQGEPSAALPPLSLEQAVPAWHNAERSQRAIARELNIGRRKVRQIIE